MTALPTLVKETSALSSLAPQILTRHGIQEGMTREKAQEICSRSYDPESWIELLNHASACYIMGYDTVALELTLQSTRLLPTAAGFINLAVIYSMQGQFVEAATAARQAYTLEPDNRTAATIHCEALLRLGRWKEAWPLFHNYWDQSRVSMFSLALPEWQSGVSLTNKRVLIVEGGGYGDNFFFLRYLPRLHELGAKLTYLCPAAMASLLRNQPYIEDVIPTEQGVASSEIRIDRFDYYTPLLSLAGKFEQTSFYPTAHSAFPRGYISSTAEIRLTSHYYRIGFCPQAAEAGNPRPFRSLNRIQVAAFRAAFRGHEYVMLVPSEGWLEDWHETARWIASCDLIVTVDTGVAHLAAAMGKPTWVILPGFSAWYYMIGYSNHPLYPKMRLFRNRGRGIDLAIASCLQALQTLKTLGAEAT